MKPRLQNRNVSFSEALRFWVKLGFINFGGPAGQIAIMHRELVEGRRWISEERFLHALNYCMLLPGPEAQQLAIYIGWLLHRAWGGIVAGAFFVIPSIFVLLALSYVYAAHGNVPAVAGVLSGFKPVVVAIVIEAVLRVGRKAVKGYVHLAIAAASFVSIYFLSIPFPVIVLAAATIGLLGARYLPKVFASQPTVKEADRKTEGERALRDELALVIDDDGLPAPHTLPSKLRIVKILSIGFVLWILPFGTLLLWRGTGSLHAQEYLFFSQAALVTFGGAYAVLAYVTQAAAGAFGWITKTQAVDGLALAETTPGPLIMVLQFCRVHGSVEQPTRYEPNGERCYRGTDTTYVTFLPSFLFIFSGAPYIEVLRGNKNLTGALSGVTSAVVGVILNLALVFGVAVIFPAGSVSNPDWFAAVMSLVSFVALYKFKAEVLWVVVAGGLIGLLKTLSF